MAGTDDITIPAVASMPAAGANEGEDDLKMPAKGPRKRWHPEDDSKMPAKKIRFGASTSLKTSVQQLLKKHGTDAVLRQAIRQGEISSGALRINRSLQDIQKERKQQAEAFLAQRDLCSKGHLAVGRPWAVWGDNTE